VARNGPHDDDCESEHELGIVSAEARSSEPIFEQTAAYAATIDSRLIIVPPRQRRFTGTVTSLAGAAQTPVLVAHERAGKPAIVAGTDLRSYDYPVLREAAELGRRLDARLVAVHNIEPLPLNAIETGWTIKVPQPPAVRAAAST
jgi:hypothetical protein